VYLLLLLIRAEVANVQTPVLKFKKNTRHW